MIPAFNVEMWIDETLRSILSQGIDGMEVIVVDDGSTDGTSAALRAWQERDERVKVVASGGVGGGSARNLGVTTARGRYLLFSDADDIVPRGAYKKLVEQLERSGSDIAAGRFLKFSSNRTWDPTQNWPVYKTLVESTTLRESPALIRGRAVWNKMFRRDFWVSHALEFPDVPRSNDIFPMTAALNRAGTIDIIPDVVYLYRERPGARSMTAQAASFAGVRSYLTQELRCAQELQLAEDNPVGRTYGRLLLEADLWVHVMRLVASQRPGAEAAASEADASELADIVKRLINSVPAEQRPRLAPAQKAVYDLVTAGALSSLAGLNDKAAIGAPETFADIEVARTDAVTALRVAGLHKGLAHIPLDFVRDRILVPLTRSLDEGDLERARSWADLAGGPEVAALTTSPLTTSLLTTSPLLTDAERTLLSLSGDGERIAVVASLRSAGAATVTLEKDRNRFRVAVPECEAQTVAAVSLRHRDEGVRRQVAGNLETGKTHAVAVSGSDLPINGVWLVEVRLQRDDIVVDVPVVSPRVSDGWPVSRWHRTVTSPIVRAGNQIAVVRRPGLPSRLATKAADIVRRRVTALARR